MGTNEAGNVSRDEGKAPRAEYADGPRHHRPAASEAPRPVYGPLQDVRTGGSSVRAGDTDQLDFTTETLAHHLFRSYLSFGIQYGKAFYMSTQFHKGTKCYSIFTRLAIRLREWWNEGRQIDPIEYLRAHFIFYKNKPFNASQLLSKFSLQIYKRHETQQLLAESPADHVPNADSEMLKYLMKVRKESEEDVLLFTYDKSVFSKAFLLINETFLGLIRQGRVSAETINAY